MCWGLKLFQRCVRHLITVDCDLCVGGTRELQGCCVRLIYANLLQFNYFYHVVLVIGGGWSWSVGGSWLSHSATCLVLRRKYKH